MLSEFLAGRRVKFIDLTLPLKNGLPYRTAPAIKYESHKEGAEAFRKRLDLPDDGYLQEAYASETITLTGHSGTHLDAPWHYGATSGGKPARTVDQVPLEWCCGDGVVLNFTHKKGRTHHSRRAYPSTEED
jgi:kynurenine formamidase